MMCKKLCRKIIILCAVIALGCCAAFILNSTVSVADETTSDADNSADTTTSISYLTFSADESFTLTVPSTRASTTSGATADATLYYTTNIENNTSSIAGWTCFTTSSSTSITAGYNSADQKYYIYLCGSGNTLINRTLSFSGNATAIDCSGDVMSLLSYSSPSTATMSDYAFIRLFQNCTQLTSAPTLSATTLSKFCYYYMFSGTSLTEAPELPATTMATYCYEKMFYNCTSLTSAPDLSKVTSATTACWYEMFYGCTSLVEPPAMPATSYWNNTGYCTDMFKGCTSLKVTTTTTSGDYTTVWAEGLSSSVASTIFSGLSIASSSTATYYITHTTVTDEATDPTCTATGLTAGSHCSVCNEVIAAQETVAALGHTNVTDEAVAATCTETGLTKGTHCSVCSTILVAQTVVDALGHSYESKTTHATYTSGGYTTYTCSCGETYTADETDPLVLEVDTTITDDQTSDAELADSTSTIEDAIDLENLSEKTRDALDAATTIYIQLEVKDIEEETVDETEAALIAEALGETDTAALYLDITLWLKAGDTSEQLTSLESPITCAITIPEELRNDDENVERTYYIIRIHEDEDGTIKCETLTGTYDAATGQFTFATDRFSTYILAYHDEVEEGAGATTEPADSEAEAEGSTALTAAGSATSPKTGEHNYIYLLLAALFISMAGVGVARRRRD